ncbi:hypothetical protein [Sphingomonas sp.]|uniref:hypothetical protein n=1 Tax=Sphingomonas sp. TaxID=28214 RepID=UPI002C1D4133|nr:hypothetical protein [Sphingomonas sp.]HWK35737.1 hypothetical protein [Sphingomonas sp.]
MRTPSLLSLLLLAGCGTAPQAPAPEPTTQPPSAFQNQVAALPDGQRNGVFIRSIRDAGFDCQGVIESHRQGEGLNGDPLYVAQCSDKKYYGVLLGRDGTAQIVTRGDR